MKTTHEVSTKTDRDSDAKSTLLTIEWPDGQNPTVQSLATVALIVKLQVAWRKHGVPSKATEVATDHAPGSRIMAKPTVEGIVAKVEGMTAAERAELIKKLTA